MALWLHGPSQRISCCVSLSCSSCIVFYITASTAQHISQTENFCIRFSTHNQYISTQCPLGASLCVRIMNVNVFVLCAVCVCRLRVYCIRRKCYCSEHCARCETGGWMEMARRRYILYIYSVKCATGNRHNLYILRTTLYEQEHVHTTMNNNAEPYWIALFIQSHSTHTHRLNASSLCRYVFVLQ